jgi:hypothetical protein
MKCNGLLTLRGLLVAILGGIVILSSCKQDETVQGFSDPSREVTFSAYAQKGSRTRVAETTSDNILDFNVFAIWSENGGTALPNLAPASVAGSNTGNTWDYAPKQLWPESGTIDFFAYSPDGATGLTPNYSASAYTDMSVNYTVPDVATSQQDLLVAVKPNVNCATPGLVSLHFQHALSRIQLKARPAVEGSAYIVSSAAFLHLSNSGTLALNTTNIPDGEGFTYKDDADAPGRIPLVLWTDQNAAATDYVFNLSTPVAVDDHSEYDNIITGNNAFLVLPQTTKLGTPIAIADLGDATDPADDKFYVKIAFASADAPAEIKVKYFAVREPLDPAKNAPLTFEAGRSYTFVVDLSGSDYINFADVEVTKFDEAFGKDLPNTDITPDPDPALTEAYMPRPHHGFAGSNIYWDAVNERLTFDDVDVITHEQYQGLYFKWGSLVGISPAEEGGHVAVYIPDGVNGAYVQSTAQDVFSGVWTNVLTCSDRNFNTEPIDGVTALRTSGFVTSLNAKPANLAAYQGDICAYLSGRPGIPAGYWRLPTSAEFDPEYPDVPFVSPGNYIREGNINDNGTPDDITDDAFIWQDGDGVDITDSKTPDGTYKISNGYRLTYGNGKTTFFPASGYRHYSIGALTGVGLVGDAWSSSPNANATGGRNLNFVGISVNPASTFNRAYSFSVRCVKK